MIRHARRLTAVAVAIVVAACGKAERRSAESPADSAAHALERSQESLGTARQQGAEQAVRAGLAALRAGSHPSESARVQRPVPQAPARKRTPPLQVGFLRPDGVVLVEFLVADSTQRVRGTDSARAWLPMPERWYITPSDAPPFDARGGLEVLAYLGESEATLREMITVKRRYPHTLGWYAASAQRELETAAQKPRIKPGSHP